MQRVVMTLLAIMHAILCYTFRVLKPRLWRVEEQENGPEAQ